MDPATMALLIRSAGEAGAVLVRLLKITDRERDAAEIEAILTRADATWQRVLQRAQQQNDS